MKETKFKETEIGRIPEEWEVDNINDSLTVHARIGWQGLKTNEYLDWGKYRLVTSTDIIAGNVNWDTCHFVSPWRYQQDNKIQLEEGDTLLSKDGTIGKVGYVRNLPSPATLNSGVFVLRPKNVNKINKEYLALCFKSVFFQNFIDKLSAGSTINHLYQKDIGSFTFPLPSLPEQRRIATALSDVDSLIFAVEKKIEKKKLIKQGAMQQLLTGKKRLPGFKGEWKTKTIKEVSSTSSGGTPSRSSEDFYKGNIRWFTTSELNDSELFDSIEHINKEAINYSSAKIFPSGTLLMAMYGATIGKLGYLHNDSATNQACCALFCERVDMKFLFYWLQYDRPNIVLLGSGAGQPNISQTIINGLIIPYPSLSEQRAIASILSDMDSELTALQHKLDKLRSLKQGMMQQLLTGKIRLV